MSTNLPLTEATFFILLSLAPKPKHGYAIMKDVEILSQGRVELSTGTLYGALKRLLAQKWIERVEGSPLETQSGAESARQRKAYALTELGRTMLNAEVRRLELLVSAAQLPTLEGLS
ncbi:PadR family transcriptional regulator [Chloroflexi bacterium TSY]|nr:PadR family transcriptional regulator [Chloroflexi bacterium TSY]